MRSTMVVAAACLVAVAGCAAGEAPTDVDVRQARALAADPLLDATPPGTELGDVYTTEGRDTGLPYQVWSSARRSGPVVGEPGQAMRNLVMAAVSGGWTITSIHCSDGGYLARGEKLVDGFRANLDLSVFDSGGEARGSVELSTPAVAVSPPETVLKGVPTPLEDSCLVS